MQRAQPSQTRSFVPSDSVSTKIVNQEVEYGPSTARQRTASKVTNMRRSPLDSWSIQQSRRARFIPRARKNPQNVVDAVANALEHYESKSNAIDAPKMLDASADRGYNAKNATPPTMTLFGQCCYAWLSLSLSLPLSLCLSRARVHTHRKYLHKQTLSTHNDRSVVHRVLVRGQHQMILF